MSSRRGSAILTCPPTIARMTFAQAYAKTSCHRSRRRDQDSNSLVTNFSSRSSDVSNILPRYSGALRWLSSWLSTVTGTLAQAYAHDCEHVSVFFRGAYLLGFKPWDSGVPPPQLVAVV